jgi:putative hemolysin
MELVFDILIVLALVFASSVYAALEIAVVYLRPSRVKELIERGGSAARVVGRFQSEPGRFFVLVQIGMTVTGTLASAIGGASAVRLIEPALRQVPVSWVQKGSAEIAMTLVVAVISYLFLVVGELVPKSLAVRYPERISLVLAQPVHISGLLIRPIVWVLDVSQSLFLRLIPGWRAGAADHVVSERELKILIDEGRRTGVISATERDLMHAVFDFADRQVRDIMVPREKVVAVPASASQAFLERTILEEGHTRMPVFGRDLDDVVGLIHARDVLYTEIERDLVNMRDIIREPFFTTPDTMISRLMKEMQRKRMHLAVVHDASGRTVGIVTLEDILEEIVGEIEDEGDVPA